MTAEPTTERRYRVEGMDCAGCARKIDTAVRRVKGVDEVNVSVAAGSMTVRHNGNPAADHAIAKQVRKLGYRLSPVAGGTREAATPDTCCAGRTGAGDNDDAKRGGQVQPTGLAPVVAGDAWWKQPQARLAIFCGLALGAAFGLARFFPVLDVYLFGGAMLIGLVPVARRAFAAATTGTPFSIEMLMTIAAVGAVIIGATEEAAVVVFLFLVGELLEGVAAGRARASIRGLSDLVPKTARRETPAGAVEEIDGSLLQVGDVIVVRPGDRIAADGEVLTGSSAVNEAPVTGESTPASKDPGDAVFAGTVNGDAVLRVKVTAAAENNTIARVIRLVEEAQEKRAPTERFIDRFSTYYTPLVVVLAALVATMPPLLGGEPWSEWIYKGLAILLIGCPCALVISTPAAIAAALSAGARRGLLMKGGAVLEEAGRLKAIAFDKTGTLTEGRPVVTDIIAFAGTAEETLRLAAALEAGSSHPLALAVLERANADGVKPAAAEDSAAVGGKGVKGVVEGEEIFFGSPRAAASLAAPSDAQQAQIAALNDQGKTVSVVVAGKRLLGAIAMRDEPREDAAIGLARLKEAGIRTLMLTGDNRRTAQAIGDALGIEVRAELMPEDKARIVAELKSDGLKIGKVGDGINDAPALATATIGIAMGGGTDVALETADAATLHGRVADIAAMIDLSKRTMANIWQNIAMAIGLKLVFFVTTILGITGLWPAILADTGATVLVTANAMRLLAWKPRS